MIYTAQDADSSTSRDHSQPARIDVVHFWQEPRPASGWAIKRLHRSLPTAWFFISQGDNALSTSDIGDLSSTGIGVEKSSSHHLSQGETRCRERLSLWIPACFGSGRRGYCRIPWMVSSADDSTASWLPTADCFSASNFLIASSRF
jgi:hypothetical protein